MKEVAMEELDHNVNLIDNDACFKKSRRMVLKTMVESIMMARNIEKRD